MKVKFKCSKCRSNRLGYQKYVKCITPVSVQKNGQLEYGLSEIDEDDYLAAFNGFCCLDCEHLVMHCGVRIETERDLLDYLTMDPEVRSKEQKEYEEIIAAYAAEQDQQENTPDII